MHKACWLSDEKQLNTVGNVDKAENKKDSHDNGRHIEVASLASSSSQQSLVLFPLMVLENLKAHALLLLEDKVTLLRQQGMTS